MYDVGAAKSRSLVDRTFCATDGDEVVSKVIALISPKHAPWWESLQMGVVYGSSKPHGWFPNGR